MKDMMPPDFEYEPFFKAPERRFAKKCLILGITIIVVFFFCCLIDFMFDAFRYDMSMTTYEEVLNDFVN